MMADDSKVKISAVLFDYGMVLSNVPKDLHWRQLEKVLEAEQDAFQAAYWKYRDAYDRGALSAQTYWESVARELDKTIDAEVLGALIDADTVVLDATESGDDGVGCAVASGWNQDRNFVEYWRCDGVWCVGSLPCSD